MLAITFRFVPTRVDLSVLARHRYQFSQQPQNDPTRDPRRAKTIRLRLVFDWQLDLLDAIHHKVAVRRLP